MTPQDGDRDRSGPYTSLMRNASWSAKMLMIFIGLVLFSKVNLWVGDWLLATGRIGPTAHLAGTAISLLMVSVVALAAAVIVSEFLT